MVETTDNALRFLNAYASIERSLNRMQCRADYQPFKKLVRAAAKKNRVVARHEEMLVEYADLRNAIVHQRGRHEEIIAEPLDSVTEDIERIAVLLDSDETALAYSSHPVVSGTDTTTIREAYELLNSVSGDKLPIYENSHYIGLVTMEYIAGWLINGGSADARAKELIHQEQEKVLFMNEKDTIMDAVLFFDDAMRDSTRAPVIIVTEHGSLDEAPKGILSSHDLSRILAAVI